jgi:prepilin-type N-terminal cleavage/methylation domain-containing protein
VHTETRGIGEEGFTLVEVLAAMIILAVGLLGLEALGIGAARSIALADRQSEYATVTSDSLESALRQLRSGTVPLQFCTTLRRGDQLSREITFPSGGNVITVTVTAIPDPASFYAPKSPFEVSSSVFLPNNSAINASGTPCS